MRNFPDFIRAYMDYSRFSEATDSFHFWTAVSTVAGALRRRVWLPMGYFEWAPNFYIIFVAKPGIINKTTTADIGMSMLREIPGVKFGPDVVTWQSLIASMGEGAEMFEYPEGTYNPMTAMTCTVGELGTFLDPTDRAMMDVMVSLWDSKRGNFSKDTKTQGHDEIVNPWLNIIACTTPAWLSGNFPEYAIGGGFTSRTIFVYGEQKRQYVPYPADEMPDTIQEERARLVEDLSDIATMAGPFTMTGEAKEWGREWYVNHYSNIPAHLDENRFGGYIARKQSHIHKLAMVISAACNSTKIITQEHMELSNMMVSATEADLPKVFSQINSDATKSMWLVLDLVMKNRTIPFNTAYRQLMNSMTLEMFNQCVMGAQTAGYLILKNNGTESVIVATKAMTDRFDQKADVLPYRGQQKG